MTKVGREYVSALTARKLVNREDIVQRIYQAIFESGNDTRVLLITAEGGMGKTFLLRKILEKCRQGGEWSSIRPLVVPPQEGRDLVDFYHVRTHTIEGFTREVWEVLGGEGSGMAQYSRALRSFKRRRFHIADLHRELGEGRTNLGRVLVDDLRSLAQNKRLLLALDTCEKLLYEVGEIEEGLRLKPEETGVLSWLLDIFLPSLGNAVILLAGRPESDVETLWQNLAHKLKDKADRISFQGLEKSEEAIEYFNAVSEAVRDAGQEDIAWRIEAIPEDNRKVIWHYTDGKPILLSLVIDHVITANRLLPELADPWPDAEAKTNDELNVIRQRIAEALVKGIQDRGAAEDDVIRALAIARKGLTAKMLGKMMGVTEDRAKRLLEGVRNLSFVKVLGDRFFLQDEMYIMFSWYVLNDLPAAKRENAYQGILSYYKDEIAQARGKVARIIEKFESRQAPLQKGVRLAAPARLPEALERLHTLLTEEMYYRWRLHPEQGFQAWEAYHAETFWANAIDIAQELDDEVREFLREDTRRDRFNGLSRREVELTLLLHRLRRMLLNAEYAGAIEIAQAARKRCEATTLGESACALITAQLDMVEGEAKAYLGVELGQAEQLLDDAVESLKKLGKSSEFNEWRRNVALAQALNVQGYLYRTIGRYKKAAESFQEALTVWRPLIEHEPELTIKRALQAQYANTLNNMAWALAWTGQTRRALRVCNDALQLRRRLGRLGPSAYSLNTFGLIQTKADQPHRAERMCMRALEIFSRLDQRRGMGFAYTALAEALRRQAALGFMYALPEAQALLTQSVDYARQAVEIFKKQKERPYLIQALIELGCAYRDWARLLKEGGIEEAQWFNRVGQSERALRRAMVEARKDENLIHMEVDAHANLAWLYYYAGKSEKASRAATKVQDRIPSEYHIRIPKEGGLPKLKDLHRTFLLVQLAKTELLLGQIGLGNDDIASAGLHFTLAMAYNELFATPSEFQELVEKEPKLREIFSPDFRDLRRAKDWIYEKVKGFRQEQFEELYKGIRTAEADYRLSAPTALEYFLRKNFGKPAHVTQNH